MLQLNLTLIIQTINFWVTYFVLGKYLFKPVIARIIEKRNEERKLKAEIVLKEKDVANFLEEKQTQLARFQQDAMVDYPYFVTRPEGSAKADLGVKKYLVTQEEKLAIKQSLKERLHDVD